MTYFTMGYWIAGLAVAVSMAGALIGFACIRQSSRSATSRFRLVWQVAAAISIGGIGVWLAVFVSMLGVAVPGSQIRYNTVLVLAAAGLAVLAVLAGLVLAGRTVRIPRLLGAGVVMGAGIGGAHYLAMDSVEIKGSVTLDPLLIGVACAVAVVFSVGTLWFTQSIRPLLTLAGGALLFAGAVSGMHYADLLGLDASVNQAGSQPTGDDLFAFFVPVFVIGILSLAVPITAILIAPDRRGVVPARITELETAG